MGLNLLTEKTTYYQLKFADIIKQRRRAITQSDHLGQITGKQVHDPSKRWVCPCVLVVCVKIR